MTVRHRESVPVDLSDEVGLDVITDVMWGAFRDWLRNWSVFERVEFALIVDGARTKTAKHLAAAQDKARRARELHDQLFGVDGLAFTRRPYPEQAQGMASLLRLIDEDELGPSIEELVGPEVLVALRRCQTLYEAMVDERMTRDDSRSVDLSALRLSLIRAIARYTSATISLVDEDDPDSLDMVRGALRPIEVLRARQTRARARVSVEEDEPLLDEGAEALDRPPEAPVAAE